MVYELPDVPGVRERWGRDVIHCPYCHGHEVRDQRVGVLATGPMAVHQTLLFTQWTPDVTLLSHTAAEPTDDQRDQLAARGVRVVEGPVAGLGVDGDRLTGAVLASGEVVALELLASGAWSGVGVLGPEAFPAQPFLDLLVEHGSPWGMEERTPASGR